MLVTVLQNQIFFTPRSWQCFSLAYAWLMVLNTLIITWTHNLVTGAFLFSFKMALWFIIHKLWIPSLAKSSEQAQAKFKATIIYKNQKKKYFRHKNPISDIKIQYKFHCRNKQQFAYEYKQIWVLIIVVWCRCLYTIFVEKWNVEEKNPPGGLWEQSEWN